MTLLFIMYLLGSLATLVYIAYDYADADEIYLSEALASVVVSAFSWIGLIVCLYINHKDDVIYRRR